MFDSCFEILYFLEGPALGLWTTSGHDGTSWAGLLEINSRSGPFIEAKIKWQTADGQDHSGVELLRGCFNVEISTITLKSYALENAKGDIAPNAIYEAVVSPCGRSLEGHWFGDPFLNVVLNGSWRASFLS